VTQRRYQTANNQHRLAGVSDDDIVSADFASDMSDNIDDGWWLPFSDYRLEDYYTVQARLDNEAERPFPLLDDTVDFDNPVTGDLPTSGTSGDSPFALISCFVFVLIKCARNPQVL
jgi:hypothetical protein